LEGRRRREGDRGKPPERKRCQGNPQLGIYSMGGRIPEGVWRKRQEVTGSQGVILVRET